MVDSKKRFIFFWEGVKDPKAAKVTMKCLSQWSPYEFTVDGVAYRCAEQYMMAEKARLFGDEKALAKIMTAKLPFAMKKAGRGVKGFDTERWNGSKFGIVVKGNLAKFTQNPKLQAYLLGTGSATLVEASPKDRVWGIGMNRTNADVFDPEKWKGENLLGRALMEVRRKLRDTPMAVKLAKKPTEECYQAARDSISEEEATWVKTQREVQRIRAERPTKQKPEKFVLPHIDLEQPTRLSLIAGLYDLDSEKWQYFTQGNQYWKWICGQVRKHGIFTKEHDVEDVAQMVVVKMTRVFGKNAYTYGGENHFRGFLKRLIVNVCNDIYKKNKWVVVGLDEDASDGDDAKPSETDRRSVEAHLFEEQNLALKEVQRLQINTIYVALANIILDPATPPRRRRYLELRYEKCLAPREIWKRDEFCALEQSAFGKAGHDAMEVLRKKTESLWKAVKPQNCKDPDAQLEALWSKLAGAGLGKVVAKKLRLIAKDVINGKKEVK